VLALGPVFSYPLWNMTFYSNQYTDGLVLHIYAHQLEGGKTPNRDDLREINSLNHYIGMRPLLESDFSEFAWLPFGIGALILLSLRAMVLGKMANLIDVFVLFRILGSSPLEHTIGSIATGTISIPRRHQSSALYAPLFGTKQT
jgi:hypothetical protein